jgi:hypothetical protein
MAADLEIYIKDKKNSSRITIPNKKMGPICYKNSIISEKSKRKEREIFFLIRKPNRIFKTKRPSGKGNMVDSVGFPVLKNVFQGRLKDI